MLANAITLGNIIFGILALVFRDNIPLASVFLFAAVICDFCDGMVARWLHQESKIGEQLDSLGDIISFGVVPGLLLYHYFGLTTRRGVSCVLFFICCGARRLARFNATIQPGKKTTYYQGTPITINGICTPILLIICYRQEWTHIAIPISYLLFFGILMISTLKIKKISFI